MSIFHLDQSNDLEVLDFNAEGVLKYFVMLFRDLRKFEYNKDKVLSFI